MGVKPQSSSTIYSDYDCCFSLGVRLKEGVILWDSKNWVQSAHNQPLMSSFKTKLGVGRHFYALRCCCCSTCDPYGLFYLSKHHRVEVHFRFACTIYYQPPQQNKAIPVHQSTDFYVLLIKTFETHPQLVGILRLLKVDVTRIIKITIKLMLFKSGSLNILLLARCLKITEKVSFNIASEASYIYILSSLIR